MDIFWIIEGRSETMVQRKIKKPVKSESLIDKAMKSSEIYKLKRSGWYQNYVITNPAEAEELCELIKDWLSGGATREAIPNLAALHRFCLDNCANLKPIRYHSFHTWVRQLRSD